MATRFVQCCLLHSLSTPEDTRSDRAALRDFSSSDFEQPSPDQLRERLSTIGDQFILIAQHPLMHAGKFAVTRRALGKPVLI